MTHSIHVSTIGEAWNLANQLFPTDYEKDEECSKNAGYPIFRSTSKTLPNAFYNYICDLNSRLEINLCGANWEGDTYNISFDSRPEWEEEPAPAEDPAPEDKPEETTKILYIGLNDKDSKRQEIDTITAFKLVSRVIREKCGGGTITQATGIYTHDNGEIVEETTLKVEIFGQPLQPVLDACEFLKTALNQESIALNEIITKSRFI